MFVILEYFWLFLFDYSCSPSWSIHTLDRFIYYFSLCCCYNLYSYYFLYNYEKLTFLWHLTISNCCCIFFVPFYLTLIHSYTSVWSFIILVNILVHILIVLLVVNTLYYYFTVNFSKFYFFSDICVFLTLLFVYSCSHIDLCIQLLDSDIISRSVVVITYILIIFCIIMKNSLFLWHHLIVSNYCCLLFILF